MTRTVQLNALALLGCLSLSGFVLLDPAQQPPASERSSRQAALDLKRALYEEYDSAFARHWQERTGQTLAIQWKQEGPERRATVLVDGTRVAPVALAPAFDVDASGKARRAGFDVGPLNSARWARFDVDASASARLAASDPENRPQAGKAPYTSTIVFLVRKGNPKSVRNWSDLVRADVAVRMADPTRSPVARWNYLAAWGDALRRSDGDEAAARDFVARLFHKAGGFEASEELALTRFVEDRNADVLIVREAEARLAASSQFAQGFEVVAPATSIRVEPAITVPDRVVLKRSSRALAQAYLDFLHAPEAQSILARHFFQPADPIIARRFADGSEAVELFTVEEMFGSWDEASARHFADGGELERILRARAR